MLLREEYCSVTSGLAASTIDDLARRCEELVAFLAATKHHVSFFERPISVASSRLLSSLDTEHGEKDLEAYKRLLCEVSERLGVAPPVVAATSPPGAGAFELCLGDRLSELLSGARAAAGSTALVRSATAEAATKWRRTYARPQLHPTAHDGVQLSVIPAGRRRRKAIVVVGPCGIPPAILKNWIDVLSADHFVLSCETRGFACCDAAAPDCSMTLDSQARDVLTSMECCGVERAHLMGICGGAVIALRATLFAPDRIESLSLWHGDFNVGEDRYLTRYQKDLRWLLNDAARSLDHAKSLHPLFAGPEMITKARRDLMHLLLFPYATTPLLYRYARANGALMSADVPEMARTIAHRALVVTSPDDRTTHPASSKVVASLLSKADLRRSAGDHLTCLDAPLSARELLRTFLSGAQG
jgi:pimeloyl-ACP methyl ester carboxylesterase